MHYLSVRLLLIMSLALETLPTKTLHEELKLCLAQAKAPSVRPISRWVEEEIILPNGPYAGQRYKHHRHPASRLWFKAMDSGWWTRFAATGPTQNGKTLMCYVAPVLYHLFEIGETVVIGVPSMDMANDKWQQDFRPVIEASDYRRLLPIRGDGSKGGQVKRAITFRNGATLRFMSAGGSDKHRAGYTTRVVAVTETDGMDESSENSREADKIEQIEIRTAVFGRTGKRVYLECTTSIESGRIWQEVKNGTDSRIARPCPHCHAFVTPEREHLVGWEHATSEEDAAAKAFFACPACGQAWSEQDRATAATKAVLVHRGQEVTPEGLIVGEPPQTQTLGFRWSAIDNPFITAADLGAEEWRAKQSEDPVNAETKMRQFFWTLPAQPSARELLALTAKGLSQRMAKGSQQGIVPAGTIFITVGVDLGSRIAHWVAIAWQADGSGIIFDYHRPAVASQDHGVELAILLALREMRDKFDAGWEHAAGGGTWAPDQVWIDFGYMSPVVMQFIAESGQMRDNRYRTAKGFGMKDGRVTNYRRPSKKTTLIHHIGEEYHFVVDEDYGEYRVDVNSDHWKSFLHERLSTPPARRGSLQFYETIGDHLDIANQLVVEAQVEQYIPGKGFVTRWVNKHRRANHFFDAMYLACAAGHFCGVRIIDALSVRVIEEPEQPKAIVRSGLTMPDGRPFFVGERE